MLDVIKQLLILQDRDRRIRQLQAELASLEPQRQTLQSKLAHSQTESESAHTLLRQLEADRKKAELEVQAKTLLIEKYSLQQFQTKKNEEYRALNHEIDTCKGEIRRLEDQQLDLMEKAENAQKQAKTAAESVAEFKKMVDAQVAALTAREQNLKRQLEELEAGRSQIGAKVEETARAHYERLLKHRGEKILVGIDRGVCGGCHMTLPPQIIVSCQTDQEIVSCPNCGRIVYYTSDMDLVASDRA